MKKIVLTTVAVIVGLHIIAFWVLNQKAELLFYYPEQSFLPYSPQNNGLTYQDVQFNSADGTLLHAWYVPAQSTTSIDANHTKGTVVFVHGNAGNLSYHWLLADWLPLAGYNLLMFDYRGYGQSRGKPSFKGTFEDTVAALRYILDNPDKKTKPVFVIGQSLGGNNAVAAIAALTEAEKNRICALVIDSTFYSYSDIAADKSFSFIKHLVNDEYSASTHIQSLASLPLLFIHGTADQVIPYAQGKKLFDLAPEPKALITVPQGAHIAALSAYYGEQYRQIVKQFFDHAATTCNRPEQLLQK